MRTWQDFLAEVEGLRPVKNLIPNPVVPAFKAQGPSRVIRPFSPLSKKIGNKKPTPRGTSHIKSD
jgi:hypothetical protein